MRSLLILLCFSSSFSLAAWHEETRPAMGTQISVSLWHESELVAKKAASAVFQEMRRIDSVYSPWIPESELAQVNKTAYFDSYPISHEFAHLLLSSLHYSRLSNGAFDITYASAGQYYDYRRQKKPGSDELKKAIDAIDFRHLLLSKKGKQNFLRFADAGVKIDLGGLAKGYAVDQAAKAVIRLGVKHANISAGGDSRVIGDKRGRPWIIGIKNPRAKLEANENDQVAIFLPLEDTAVSTSGDYERFFIDQSSQERIHHIINPVTGLSAQGIASVTVLGQRGLDTDPLSTTVFVLGVKKGLQLIETLPGFDCIIIDSAGKVHFSSGLKTPG